MIFSPLFLRELRLILRIFSILMQSWAWTSVKVVPQLLKILESCKFENVNAGIVVLLGQLGRYVFDNWLGTKMFLA